MPVTLRNILNLSSLSEMKLIAGREGLDRVLTRSIVGQNDCISGCVYGGELMLITGVGFKADTDTLKSLISEGCLNNLAGIVFSTPSDYIPMIDSSVIDFANSLTFPMFQIPWDTMLVEVTKDMSNFINERQNDDNVLHILMQKMISSSPDETEGLKKRIARLGYDSSCAYQVEIMRITRSQSAMFYDTRYNEYVHLFARNLLNQRCHGVMTMSRYDDVVIFVPECLKKNILTELIGIRDAITIHFEGTNVNIGVGNSTDSLSGLYRSLSEAENALKINTGIATTSSWNIPGSGMFNLFHDTLNYAEIETFCDQNIGKLIDYDKLNGTEFVHTIEIYFENRFNLSRAAKILMIHRNSLMYRLSRIEEIIGRKLDDPYVFLDIINSIMIKKMNSSTSRATG